MDKFLPHETRILKSRVPKKKTNEDDDEDEEPEMKKWRGRRSKIGEEEVELPDLKTSLENADSAKKNHELKERRTVEEEATQALGK